ncbi:MAG: hypothetical protein OHK0028_13000 [Deltaproteobacteria bacterium]
MSDTPSLWTIDWRLARGTLVRETIGRFLFFVLLGFALLAILRSGAGLRYLAGRYAVTAVLRADIPPAEANGLARKIAALPPVRSASYTDPETAWKEFLRAYPGLEPLRESGGNPLPGYIEVRFRPERFNETDVGLVSSALRSVSRVDQVLAGEEWLPGLLRAGRCASGLCWGVFGLFLAGTFVVNRLQERGRAAALAGDFAFLAERGVPVRRLALSRAAAAAVSGGILAAAGTALAGGVLVLLLREFPFLERVFGSPADLPEPRTIAGAALFVLAAALLSAASSLLGFRASRAGGK